MGKKSSGKRRAPGKTEVQTKMFARPKNDAEDLGKATMTKRAQTYSRFWQTTVAKVLTACLTLLGAAYVLYVSLTSTKGDNSPALSANNSSNVGINQGVQITIATNHGQIGQVAGTINNNSSPNAATKEDMAIVQDMLRSLGATLPSKADFERRYPLGFVVYGLSKFRIGGIPYSLDSRPKEVEIDWASPRLLRQDDGMLLIVPPTVRVRNSGLTANTAGPSFIRVENVGEFTMAGGQFELKPGERKTIRVLTSAKLNVDLEILASGDESAVAVVGFSVASL